MLRFINHAALLERITDDFISDVGLAPIITSELEFYLEGAPKELPPTFHAEVARSLSGRNISVWPIENEVAPEQFEISLKEYVHPIACAQNSLQIVEIIREAAKNAGYKPRFDAKPFADRPGCGLHFHLIFLDKSGINALIKTEDDCESQTMRHAVGGLLDTTQESFIFFAPNANSYTRFTTDRNPQPGLAEHNSAPINISWGGNNRTCAIRIPASTSNPALRHIEHRVCGVDANPYLALGAILLGALKGIREEIEPYAEKVYGNAYDDKYDLVPFPASYEEALGYFNKSKLMQQYFKEFV